VQAFEQSIADYTGTATAFSTTSATTAMHLVLAAYRIGPGDEVLVSDFTFPATGNVVVQTGATPVLVDCVPGRFDMDPDDLAAKVTPKSRAIIVVHPFGQPAEMDRINAIAQQHGLRVIEDGACALGAKVSDGRACGSVSDAGCFSFHPRKLLTTGEGGMIVTDDHDISETLAVLRSHGARRGAHGFEFVENGYNYRMSEIQAALGLEQIKRFDDILESRREIAKTYMDLLKPLEPITIPMSADISHCTIQSFVVMLSSDIDRNALSTRLREAGIETTLGTYAMHSHPAFARFGYEPGDLQHSYLAQEQSLTLPLYSGMTDDDIDMVVQTIAQLTE
jgi:dTDP-4-amino-4,6-dideoxygalactose transaminase